MAQAAPFKSGQRVQVTEGSYAGDTGTVWKSLPDYTLVRIHRKGEGTVRLRTANLAPAEGDKAVADKTAPGHAAQRNVPR